MLGALARRPLPTDFGFPCGRARPRAGHDLRLVPIKSDSEHYPLRCGAPRVPQPHSAATEWEALTNGLPQRDCYVNVLREVMAVDSTRGCGVYFGTTRRE